jgi:hypothetical protein
LSIEKAKKIIVVKKWRQHSNQLHQVKRRDRGAKADKRSKEALMHIQAKQRCGERDKQFKVHPSKTEGQRRGENA